MTLDLRSRAIGCLLGGAVGDALGAPVEFQTLAQIRESRRDELVRNYRLAYGRMGAITDDTQMTLFTAEALLTMAPDADLVETFWRSYRAWAMTQVATAPQVPLGLLEGLLANPALYSRRAPGNTCLAALHAKQPGTISLPLNDSKGCGGIMRVAPIGIVFPPAEAFDVAVQAAAVTHGHPSGYLSAGAFAFIISRLMRGGALEAAALDARALLKRWGGNEETYEAISKALWLYDIEPRTPETIEARLGAGWTGEEALGIALFCALGAHTFEEGVSLAVTHSGDSDSTGELAGQLLGAIHGEAGIPVRWLQPLELRKEVIKLAVDLAEKVEAS